jgi:hypothetical protein
MDTTTPAPALKGKRGGNCNRECCQRPGANWYNHWSHAYYCQACAFKLNDHNPEAAAQLDHDLCTRDETVATRHPEADRG